MHNVHDERNNTGMFTHQVTRQLSATPPPVFSYGNYTTAYPEQYLQNPYSSPNAYTPLPAPYSDMTQGHYLPPLPNTLPMMLPGSGSMKRECMYAEEDIIGPFSMSYASMPGIDIPTTQVYNDSNAHVILPPCHHSHPNLDPIQRLEIQEC